MTRPSPDNLCKEHTTNNSPTIPRLAIQVLHMLEHDLEKLEGHPHQHHHYHSGGSMGNGDGGSIGGASTGGASIGSASIGGGSMSSAGSFDHLDGLVSPSLRVKLAYTLPLSSTHTHAYAHITPHTHAAMTTTTTQDLGGSNGACKRTEGVR